MFFVGEQVLEEIATDRNQGEGFGCDAEMF